MLSIGDHSLNLAEKQIKRKLAYEWKNIYRNLVSQDQNETSLVDLNELDTLCVRFKVSLTQEELQKIRKLFGVHIEEMGDEEVLYENWQGQ